MSGMGGKRTLRTSERLVGLLRGGEGGIRTHGTVAHTPHFECGAFDHSATSPLEICEDATPPGRLGRARRSSSELPPCLDRGSWPLLNLQDVCLPWPARSTCRWPVSRSATWFAT